MIKIITDTSCGIPVAALQKAGIEVLPQIVTFGNSSYRDDNELDTKTFLKKLRESKELPKTAAPPHALYTPIYQNILNKNDYAIVLTPSAEVSGTFRSANLALKDFKTDRIKIVDTRTIAGGFGSLVMKAKQWADEGKSIDDIVTDIQIMASREKVFFMVPTLEYLYKGGRIGGAAKLFGTLLKIVPILTVSDGKVEPFEKLRTIKQANQFLLNHIVNICKNSSEPHLIISHCHNHSVAQFFKESLESELKLKDIPIFIVPPAIVVHVGPEAISISCFPTETLL